MSDHQLPVIIPSETALITYVDSIKKHLTNATVAWRQIADILSAAADEFGLESNKMKSLRKQTSISKSKMSKLISIAKSKRLHDHWTIFELTNAWTVLYEVTKLTDDEFATLLDEISEGEVVTQKMVNAARTKIIKEPDPYKTVFSIQIDLNAIKAEMFSGDDYEKLAAAIEVIQNTLKYVRVVETEEYNSVHARFFSEVKREFEKLARTEFKAAINSYRQRAKDKKHFGNHTEQELRELMREQQYKAVFDILESDRFNETKLYNKAIGNVRAKREERFGCLVGQPKELANSQVQAAA